MSSDCCGSSLDTSALETRQRRILGVVLVINALTFVMMVLAAWHSGSSSLLVLFLRSALRVLRRAWTELDAAPSPA